MPIHAMMPDVRAVFESELPNPDPADLSEALAAMAAVRISDRGHAFSLQTVALVEDCESLHSLKSALALQEDVTNWGHCMCLGQTTLTLLPRGDVIGVHHGVSIRWDARWKWDAPLANGLLLAHWLAEHGSMVTLEEMTRNTEAAARQREEEQAWVQTMPAALLPYWEDMRASWNLNYDLYEQQLASIPVPERARLLLRWFSFGVGRWNGYPSWEGVPEQLLLRLPRSVLIEAAPDQLDGAARLFSSWHFRQHRRKLPKDLRARVKAYLEGLSDPEKRALSSLFE